MKKILLLFIVLLTVGLLACVSAETNPEDTGIDSADNTDIASVYPDKLPADLNLDGRNVKIFIGDYNNALMPDMYSEETTGNRLNDAVFNTISAVQERLNVELDYAWEEYTYDKLGSFTTKIISTILAGENAFDILFDLSNYATQMIEGEYFINLTETKYIDAEAPYYNQTIIENMPDDYIHFLVGDFSLVNTKSSYCVYFNDTLYKSLGLTENLYDTVDSGKWTHAKLVGLIKDSYADLNGNNTKDFGDRFGLTFGDTNKYLGFQAAYDCMIFRKVNGEYKFTYDSERVSDAITLLVSLVNENGVVLPGNANNSNFPDFQVPSGGGNYANKVFIEGRSLFSCGLIADAETIVPNIDFSYGLLPYPKFDENQSTYMNTLQRNCYALIPITVSNEEAVSAVFEALASESSVRIIPEYCEVSLKVRYSQDNDVSRMFDLVRQSVVFDPGVIYGIDIGSPRDQFRTMMINNTSNWASYIASVRDSIIKKMNSITEK